LHAWNAKEETIRPQKIREQPLTSWNLINIAGSAENTRCIKKPNKLKDDYF
jgi:hypothetical protein